MKLAYLSESADLSPYAMSAVLVDDEQWPKVYAGFHCPCQYRILNCQNNCICRPETNYGVQA